MRVGFAGGKRRSQATRWMPAFDGPVRRRTTLPSASFTVSTTAGSSSRASARRSAWVGYAISTPFLSASFSASSRALRFVFSSSFR